MLSLWSVSVERGSTIPQVLRAQWPPGTSIDLCGVQPDQIEQQEDATPVSASRCDGCVATATTAAARGSSPPTPPGAATSVRWPASAQARARIAVSFKREAWLQACRGTPEAARGRRHIHSLQGPPRCHGDGPDTDCDLIAFGASEGESGAGRNPRRSGSAPGWQMGAGAVGMRE